MGILEQYRDTSLDVTPGMLAKWSPEQEAERQRNRLMINCRMAMACGQIPRRLGADATASELANDKRTARRVQHAMRRVAVMWAVVPRQAFDIKPDDRKAGAVVQWGEWFLSTTPIIESERTRVATMALAAGERRFGNRALHNFAKEEEGLRYAAR